MTFTAFPTQASSWNFTKLVTSFGFTTQQEQQPPGKTDSKEEEQSTRSMDSSPGRPATKQKRSFADITMKLTEAAEEMFLFGTQDYHERTSSARPAKRQRRSMKRQESWEGQEDYTLNTKAVFDLARASSSLLDSTSDSHR